MVCFVGAGPGAKDLITVRGLERIKNADVIIYAGSLVNPALLEYADKSCTIYNSAEMTLEEVLDVMKKGFQNKQEIVRLHTGDPSLYGAVREQMDALEQLEIPYEVCPGVSSFCGASAALKAEYTLPGVSQTVIITRAEGRTSVPKKERLCNLAVHNATMVLFLSTGLLEQVKAELLLGGYADNTPCAIVYKATWEDEKVVRGVLKELPQLAEEHGIKKTALVIVGRVLASDYKLSRLYAADFSTEFREASK